MPHCWAAAIARRCQLLLGRSRATVNAELRTLRAGLRRAGIKHVSIKMLREDRALPEVLTDGQQRDYLELPEPLRRAVRVMLEGGEWET